ADTAEEHKGAVPKTVPPEETFTPQPESGDSGAEAVPATRDAESLADAGDDDPESPHERTQALHQHPGMFQGSAALAAQTADDGPADTDAGGARSSFRSGSDEDKAARAGTEAMPPGWSPPVAAAGSTQLGGEPFNADF